MCESVWKWTKYLPEQNFYCRICLVSCVRWSSRSSSKISERKIKQKNWNVFHSQKYRQESSQPASSKKPEPTLCSLDELSEIYVYFVVVLLQWMNIDDDEEKSLLPTTTRRLQTSEHHHSPRPRLALPQLPPSTTTQLFVYLFDLSRGQIECVGEETEKSWTWTSDTKRHTRGDSYRASKQKRKQDKYSLWQSHRLKVPETVNGSISAWP